MTLNKYKNIKIVIGLILILVVILISGAMAWNFYLNSNPNKLFVNSIVGELKKIDLASISKERYLTNKGDLVISNELKNEESALDKSEDINILWDCKSDTKELKSLTSLLVKFGSNSILDTDIVMSDSKLYVKLKDVFDKYIEISTPYNEKLNYKYNEQEVEALSKHVIIAAAKSLNKEYFVVEKQNIEEGNKKLNVNTVSLKLNEKRIKEISVNALQNIKNDGYTVEELARLNEITKIEQIDKLQKMIKDIQDNSMEDETTEITITVSVDFFGNLKQIKVQKEDGISAIYKKYNKIKEIILNDANKSTLNIKNSKNNIGDSTTIVGVTENVYLSGLVKNKNIDRYSKSGEYYIYTKGKETDIAKQFEIKGDYSTSSKTVKKSTASEFNMTVNIELNSKKAANFKVKVKNNQEVVNSYISPDLSKTVKLENLTEADYSKIYAKEPLKSLIGYQQLISLYLTPSIAGNEDKTSKRADFEALSNERLSLKGKVQSSMAVYMANNNGAVPTIITEGNEKSGELKIELSETEKIFIVSSGGDVIYKPDMTVEQFIQKYGLSSKLEVPDWVILK